MYASDHGWLSRYRNYIRVATFLFALGIVLGIIAAIYYPDIIQQALHSVGQQLESLGRDIFAGSLGQGIWILFLHNLRALLLIAGMGLLLGIYPVFAMLVNGLLIGVVAVMTTQSSSLMAFLAGIVPHGIFEIPALLIGAGVGLRLGIGPWRNRKRNPYSLSQPANAWQGYRYELASGVQVMLICVLLLLVEAVIEVSITPRLITLFI